MGDYNITPSFDLLETKNDFYYLDFVSIMVFYE
jgi:hypothetical protein